MNNVLYRHYYARFKLWKVSIVTDTHPVAFNVLSSSSQEAIDLIPDTIGDYHIIDVKRSYGYMREYDYLYKRGYRVMGVLNDTDTRTLVSREKRGRDIEQLTLTVDIDENWLENVWISVKNIEKINLDIQYV